MREITLGEALAMAPVPYLGKMWLSVADYMAIEGVGEQKSLELLAAERRRAASEELRLRRRRSRFARSQW